MANSPKYHPITEKLKRIINARPDQWECYDKDVRSYLEACATKLVKAHWHDIGPWYKGKLSVSDAFNNILGLGDVEVEKDCGYGIYYSLHCSACETKPKAPKETPDVEAESCGCKIPSPGVIHRKGLPCYVDKTPKQQWPCDHPYPYWFQGEAIKDSSFCPICGTPRPLIKSREERLAEILWSADHDNQPPYDFKDCHESSKKAWIKLASAAIEWIELNNGNRASEIKS